MPASDAQIGAFERVNVSEHSPDLLIGTGTYRWRVHSELFAEQSTFFEQVRNGSFKESVNNEVFLHDNCPWIVARMIQFVYLGYYDCDHYDANDSSRLDLHTIMRAANATDDSTELTELDDTRSCYLIHAMVYQIADKYDFTSLRAQAATTLGDSFEDGEQRDDEAFFEILDCIGVSSLHNESDLLERLISAMSDAYMADPTTFDRFEQLLGTDKKVTMALIRCISKKHQELEEYQKRSVEVSQDVYQGIKALEEELMGRSKH